MTAGKVVAAIIGAILGLVSFGLVVGGGAVVWAYGTQRDDAGFVTSPDFELDASGFALVSPEFDMTPDAGDWFPTGVADVRVEVESDTPVFVGVGPSGDVEEYLSGVAFAEVTGLDFGASEPDLTPREGGAPASAPSGMGFWTVSREGTGTQALTWELEPGAWSVVIMNADASAGVEVTVAGGIRTGLILVLGVGALVVGLLLGVLAAGLLVFATRRPSAAEEAGEARPATVAPGGYPATLEGTLDPGLSRWMWLVKWFLVIPHLVVLAFLFAAFAVLTIVAFFAILFTGRYPRGIFDFNVGVLRWTWRVQFYAFDAIGTDRYPPFTLEDVEYPARFDVEYPERLSQGLVLVKWWLLAIPHYIVVGLLTNGLVWWSTDIGDDSAVLETRGGLIGILVLVAGIVLLFTGRYPRPLFDLIVGLNRWVFRVISYAALMRDEYPPFRLDLGGSEEAASGEGAGSSPRP